ncbi:uncharacterized protein LOC124371599 [Homalodisca vitripennis]|uniref:uncharacterized protein LOC124371599 n=1 Tax=Homalodisca vitripennis TaxID=197043 RepID=UPI001EECEC9C|nr:uncharacterized protein LOC124371599 [Homalodisca vitripennis]
MCNTIHRKDKWLDHCKKKHSYKFKNNLKINYKVVEIKVDNGPWQKYVPDPSPSQSTSLDDIPHTLTSRPTQDQDEDVFEPTSESFQDKSTSEIETDAITLPLLEVTDSELETQRSNQELEEQEPDNFGTSDVDEPDSDISSNEDHSDPASYANLKLSPEDINVALNLENQDLSSIEFPSTGGRKFNPLWKNCILPNNSVKPRKWLVYSKKKDAVFCLPCTLFALPTERSVWGTTGYRGWTEHRGERDFLLHETSKNHISAEVARIQWISQKRIDSSLAQQCNRAVDQNREVLSVVIDCCSYLSEEMIAFRKNDVLEGKLLGLFRLIGKYSPDARVYLEKIDRARAENVRLGSNFLSYRNIFDLINTMSDVVVNKIVTSVNLTNIYSIILDSTQDVSKKECTTIIVRYIEHMDDTQQTTISNVKPKERLVKVFTSGDTSGEMLFRELKKCLKALNLDPKGIVGQSMDGAGNMRGQFKGLKSLVTKENPKAFYVWCCSHRFALVVEQSLDICCQMRNLFSFLEDLYVFMSGHRRHHLLLENLEKGEKRSKRRLKRVQTTRWSSKTDALQTIVSCFETIRDTLQDLSTDKNSDNNTKAKAIGPPKANDRF